MRQFYIRKFQHTSNRVISTGLGYLISHICVNRSISAEFFLQNAEFVGPGKKLF